MARSPIINSEIHIPDECSYSRAHKQDRFLFSSLGSSFQENYYDLTEGRENNKAYEKGRFPSLKWPGKPIEKAVKYVRNSK